MSDPYRTAPAGRLFVTTYGATDLSEVIDVWHFPNERSWKVQFRHVERQHVYGEKDGKLLFDQWVAYRREQGV